jgi:hypothetical protein
MGKTVKRRENKMAKGKETKKAAKPVKSKGNVVQFKQKFESNFEGFIKKIRIDAKTDIPDIDYGSSTANADNITILSGRGKPLDSFLTAMQNLARGFCEICEFPEEKIDDVLITTVNFSEKGGVIISGQVALEKCPAPLCLNTPHVLIENETGFEIPSYMKSQLDELRNEAVKYIRGEWAEKQMDLFEEAAN